ncbi:MAG TPA: TetR/AcrR family transcriptional regulator, partial [Burkholderiaceae bacterium]|nr:TetR/AcrR family transcriptional regulator [Burkholderiaceae bacterium]
MNAVPSALDDAAGTDAHGHELPRWRRRKDARPQEIVQAALDLFVERGYAATRAEDVAARAGVSKGTLYLYFANKEELFRAVISEGLGPVLREATELVDRYQGNTFDLLEELYWGWFERVGATKLSGIKKLVVAEVGNFPELSQFYQEAVIEPAHAMMVKLLERGVARGEFRAVDTDVMTHVMISPMLMLFIWKHTFSAPNCCMPVDPIEYVRSTIELIKHGLAAGAVPPAATTAPMYS